MIERINSHIKKSERKYYARITYYENGKRRFKWLGYYDKRKDCKKAADDFIDELENLTHNAVPFNRVAAHYKDYYQSRRKTSSIKTINNIINNHLTPYFRNTNMHKIKPKDILDFQTSKLNDKKNYSGEYLKKMHNVLSAVFNHGINYFELLNNPLNTVPNFEKASNKRNNIWNIHEFEYFIDNVDNLQWKLFFSLLFYTGARKGEIRALKWSDYNPENQTLNITKTDYNGDVTQPKTKEGYRSIPINQTLCELLNEFKVWYQINKAYDDDFVIFGEVHTSISDTGVDRAYSRYMKDLKLKRITLHEFRHSHASDLINRLNADPYIVAERLGHSSVSEVLNRYGHLYPNKQRDLINKL